MDVYRNIWSWCDKAQLERHGQLISDAVLNQGVFQNSSQWPFKNHIGEVNNLLNNNKTRDRGLRSLADMLPHCAQQFLSAQSERWFRFCCDAVKVGKNGRQGVQACQLLSGLLRDLPSLPELQRCVTAKTSAAIVLNLAAADPQGNPAALECLYQYVRAAPGPCLQHKNEIEERMLHHLDHPASPASLGGGVARLAGRVFAALPLPGVGGGNVAQSRADAVGRRLGLLLALAHSLMDTLLDGVLEKESFPHPREHGSLKVRPVEDMTPAPMMARLLAITRLINTLVFIAEMVTDDANPSITVAPNHLLSVVVRLLQVELSVLNRYKSQEHKLVAFFLPSLHNQALLLLRDMISSLGDGIESYHNILGDLLTSVLRSYKFTKEKKEEQPPWCSGGLQTRVLSYGVLAELLKASRGRHTPPGGLVAMVVQDASPQEHSVKLQKGLASLTLHKSSGKKKGYTVTSEGSGGGYPGPVPRPGTFGRLARAALVAAEMMFTHSAHSMHFEDHQRLQTGILTIAEGVLGASQLPAIYRDARVRVQLFHTLAALSAAPHPRSPPPYPLLTHLLHTGAMDEDVQVASACQMTLCSLGVVVSNPRVEAAAQAIRQHQSSGRPRDEEEDEEVDMIIEQLQEEEEEEEEEEPVQNNKIPEEAEKEEEEEEVEEEEEEDGKSKEWETEDSFDSLHDEEEEDDKIDKGKEEGKKNGRAKNGGSRREEEKRIGKTSHRKNEGIEDDDKGGEKEEEEEEETEKGGNKRGDKEIEIISNGETQTKNTKRKTENRQRTKKKKGMEEEEEEEVKRNGVVESDTSPAKKVKLSANQQGSEKEGSGELTVDEMLQDFVEG